MNIIIAGAGEVGNFLCQTLSEEGHNVTVIETDEQKAVDIEELQNVRSILGNASTANCLIEAGIASCNYFLALTQTDQVNMVSCKIAKVLGAKNTICRIKNDTYFNTAKINYQSHFGIDFLLAPEVLCAVELAKKTRNPERVMVENFARGTIEVHQVKLDSSSKMLNTPLKDLNLNNQIRIGYMKRGDTFCVPDAQSVFQEDDVLTIIGTPEALFDSSNMISPKRQKTSVRVVIFGGSDVARAIIRLLNNPKFKIRLIEKDIKTCKYFAEKFPNITVINGSATSLRLLEEEQIESADYFISCTKDDDEENIMTCLQAIKLGCKSVGLVIGRPDYSDVMNNLSDALGIDLAVSPRVATANEVKRLISNEKFIVLSNLAGGEARILQIPVSPNSPVCGEEIRFAKLPKGCLVIAQMHKFQIKMPTATDVILAEDKLIVIVPKDVEKQLLKLLA